MDDRGATPCSEEGHCFPGKLSIRKPRTDSSYMHMAAVRGGGGQRHHATLRRNTAFQVRSSAFNTQAVHHEKGHYEGWLSCVYRCHIQ